MEYKKLKELCEIKHGYAFKGKFITAEETENVLVTPGNFRIGGGFKEDKCKYYKKEGEIPEEYILKPNDLIVTMTDLSKNGDTLGYSAIIPENSKKKYLHNQRIGLVNNINTEYVLKKFLYWYMRTHKYQKQIVGSSTGTTVKHTSPDRILDIGIPILEKNIQTKVVNILDNIEIKILLNSQINDNLFELIKNEYLQMQKSIKNYEFVKLKDIAKVSSGKRPKNKGLDYSIPLIGASGIMSYTEDYNSNSDVIVIGRVGTLGIVQRYFDNVWLSDNTISLKTEYSNVLENYLKYVDYKSLNRGSTQPLITKTDINNLEIKFNSSTFGDFETEVKPLRKKIVLNIEQNKILEELRDTLLPKLINGEIDLDKIEI